MFLKSFGILSSETPGEHQRGYQGTQKNDRKTCLKCNIEFDHGREQELRGPKTHKI